MYLQGEYTRDEGETDGGAHPAASADDDDDDDDTFLPSLAATPLQPAAADDDEPPNGPHQDVFIAWCVGCLLPTSHSAFCMAPAPGSPLPTPPFTPNPTRHTHTNQQPQPPTHSLQVSTGHELFARTKYFEGDRDDLGAHLITDPSDPTALYAVGLSLSPLFLTPTGAALPLPPGTRPPHAWIVRMDGPSSQVRWVKSLGSIASSNATVPRLAVDGASGALYISGATFLSIPASAGAGGGGPPASTVLRVDAATGDLVWARAIPQAWAVAIQPTTGQPFVAGCVFVFFGGGDGGVYGMAVRAHEGLSASPFVMFLGLTVYNMH